MVVAALQTGVIAAIAVYLGSWRATQRRRQVESWESLIARLQHDWSARSLSEHFPWKEGLSASPEDTWKRIDGARGLWAMYKNAGVMLEMASYAAEHSDAVDPILLQTLRADATQIRFCALITLAQCVFSQAGEGVRINAFRAASIYTGMAARMTQLLQDTAASALPEFVAAM